ncbi:MAG: hypothetical protein QXX56_00130 [Candidatus Bathyarchaeia archaeon]
MVKRSTLMKLSLLMVEFTSIPLVVLASVYLLTGYQMLVPDLRILPEPMRIHVDRFLRVLAIFLAYIHALGGIIIMAERRLRRELQRKIAEISAIIVLTTLLIISLITETVMLDVGYRWRC